jgi:hypothetical protein
LRPLLEKTAVLVEDLNAIVVAICDEQSALRIEREGMRDQELPRARAGTAPFRKISAVGREFHDAIVRHRLVAVADEHVTVRCDDDVGRAVEVRRPVARVRRCAEAHELAAVRPEFDDLMPAIVAASRIGHPDVARGIDVDAVRPGEHARAECAEPFAVGSNVQDRIDVAVRQAIVRAAALRDP